jgi:diguanylate cyclase (GGDEF)-like protein/PAS domain S-box-containing protein
VSRITGYDFDEITSTPFVDFLHPSERPRVLERYERRMSGEVAPSVYETIVVGKDGREIWVEINAGLITFRGGPADLAFVRDITERKRMEASLRDISEKMQRLHETARRLATCESEDEVYRVAAEAAETTLAFSMCSVDAVENGVLRVKATSSQLLPGMSQSRSLSDGGLAAETHRTGKVFVFGSLDEVPQANPVDASIASGISVPIGDIGVLQIVSTERDAFTEEDARLLDVLARHAASAIRRIRLQSELERQASRDPLTDAYNRRYFTQTIEQEIARSRRYEHPIALLMIDVNRFKEINDRFGHLIGDRILLEVAALLRSQVREADVVVRYGGDEFLIVQPETGGDCTSTIARIQAGLTEWNANSQLLDFPLTLAIGAACWQPSAERPFEVVLNEADRRMYENKHEADSA